MDTYDVKRLALVLAIQAEIEGMKAYNDLRARFSNDPPKYLQQDFDAKAEELRIIAYKHNDQL